MSNDDIWDVLAEMKTAMSAEVEKSFGEPPFEWPEMYRGRQREFTISGLKVSARDEPHDAEASHQLWFEEHKKSGYTYGHSDNPADKQLPHMLPWDQLPESTRLQHKLCELVVRAGMKLIAMKDGRLEKNNHWGD